MLYAVIESNFGDFVESQVHGVYKSKDKAKKKMDEIIDMLAEDEEIFKDELRCSTLDGRYAVEIHKCEIE